MMFQTFLGLRAQSSGLEDVCVCVRVCVCTYMHVHTHMHSPSSPSSSSASLYCFPDFICRSRLTAHCRCKQSFSALRNISYKTADLAWVTRSSRTSLWNQTDGTQGSARPGSHAQAWVTCLSLEPGLGAHFIHITRLQNVEDCVLKGKLRRNVAAQRESERFTIASHSPNL